MATSDVILISDSESDGEVAHNSNTDDSNIPRLVKERKRSSTISGSPDDSSSPSTISDHENDNDKSNVNDDDVNSNGNINRDNDINIRSNNESNYNNIDFAELSKEPTVEKKPSSQETFYIDPEVKRNFQFEYSRTTNRPGPKSRTRKTLTHKEMYNQIFRSGLNPSNGLKIVDTKQDAS